MIKPEKAAAVLVLLYGWRRLAVAFGAGLASALALPPLNIFAVMFLTVPVLIWIMDGVYADARRGLIAAIVTPFACGWSFGFGYFFAGMWWVGSAFLVEADVFVWLLPFAVILLPAGLAMFFGVAAIIARLFWSDHWLRCLAIAFAFSGMEYVRGFLLTGLPWNTLGYTAMPFTVTLQSGSVLGLHGVTLIALLVYSLPLVALATPASMGQSKRIPIMLAACIALTHLGYGAWRLSANPVEYTDVTVRLMQPAIDQRDKFDPEQESGIMASYLALSAGTGSRQPGLEEIDYLIWPESAFPFLLTERRDVLAAIGELLPENTRLVTGAMRAEPGAAGDPYGKVYNSVLLVESNGEIAEAADKTHLVPFGEYLPFQTMLESVGLEQLTRLRGGFEEGASRRLLARDSSHPLLPLICYEIIFPGEIRPQAGDAAGDSVAPKWIVNLTNDAWFGFTPGPYQHLQQSLARTVEEGLPLARVANTGISVVSDPFGRIVERLDLGARGIVDSRLPAHTRPTIYSRYGDLPFHFLLGLLAAGAFSGRMRSRITATN